MLYFFGIDFAFSRRARVCVRGLVVTKKKLILVRILHALIRLNRVTRSLRFHGNSQTQSFRTLIEEYSFVIFGSDVTYVEK